MTVISAAEYLDMEWYGVDWRGGLAVFCSAGAGNLSGFVLENQERADALIEYFQGAARITGSRLCLPKTGPAERVAREFSDRGLYYFDADDGTTPGVCSLHAYYTKHSEPRRPLRYAELPEDIREILSHNLMETEDFSLADVIRIGPARDRFPNREEPGSTEGEERAPCVR